MEKKKISISSIILIAIIIVFILNAIRNYIIITSMNDKASKYTNSQNYHVSISTLYNGDIKTIEDYYKKDKDELSILRSKLRIIQIYNKNNKRNLYTKSEKEKLCKLNTQKEMSRIEITTPIENNFKIKLLESLFSIIYSDNTDNIKCYKLSSIFNKRRLYINKDNGLVIKEQVGIKENMIKYDFNNVTDEIFNEPDVKEYILVK